MGLLKRETVSRPIALIAGDLHMMHHAWVDRKTLFGDAEYGLWQIAYLSGKFGLPILLAGDQFNSTSPDLSTLGTMIRMQGFLAETNGCYIQGNHDKTSPPWMKLVVRHWTHLEEGPADLGTGEKPPDGLWDIFRTSGEGPLFDRDKRWHVYGLDYLLSQELLADRLSALGKTIRTDPKVANLLVLHQEVPPWTPAFTCQLLDGMVPDCFDMLVVGHVHDAQVATIRSRRGRPIRMVSPGGVHLLDVTENPRKKIWLLQANGSLLSVPLQSRNRRTINLCGLTESERKKKIKELCTTLSKTVSRSKAIDTPIVYAVCDNASAVETRKMLLAELGDTAHLFVSRKAEHEKAVQGIDAARLEDIDVRRYLEDGFVYAQKVIQEHEPDKAVQRIIGSLLASEINPALYHSLKTEFQEKQPHV